jgi:CDP-glycerol glycerophosphotransferase
VVGQSVNDLAEGLRAFLRGEVPVGRFDGSAYNKLAMEQFYAAIR